MLNEQKITELTEKGFNRWTKGNLDRLYINAAQLGLVCSCCKTGNIRWAEFNGTRISNCLALRYKTAKTFIDIKTGKVFSDCPALADAARTLAGLE